MAGTERLVTLAALFLSGWPVYISGQEQFGVWRDDGLQPNYAILGQAIKLYTDAMRRLIRERLTATYGNRWWEEGVLGTLSPFQVQNLEHNLKPNHERLEHLDASHFDSIVTKNFNSAFDSVFHDFKLTKSFLVQIAEVRNRWAHPTSGDFDRDEVEHDLYTMVRLLSLAGLPEAEAIRNLRSQLQVRPMPIRRSTVVSLTSSPGESSELGRTCREQLINAARAIITQTGRNAFTPQEIVDYLKSHGSRYPESTIRTQLISACCVNAPQHHAVKYHDFERIGHGLYRLISSSV